MASVSPTWLYSKSHNKPGKVIDKQTLWGETVYQVWLPDENKVVSLKEDQVQSLDRIESTFTSEYISYIATAAKIADCLTREDIFLAPIESSVIPLPHQIKVLSKAMADERVRYLLADEVGLGKTIEAGLIMKELKLRGLVKRILVVVPSGLAGQWVSEMETHFGEEFILINPGNFNIVRSFTRHENPWQSFDQVVCSMDSVKPLEKRRGWSKRQVDLYNGDRFDGLVNAGWDLIVVDEAHRLGGSTDQVARYKLGQGLAQAGPYLLLLSATPHQGKTDSFHRLMTLLDKDVFPDEASISKEHVAPYIVRTEKRQAIDHQGKALFKPRRTQLVPIAWQSKHNKQKQLYEAVTEYVRQGYNQALLEKKNYVGFLMILMQRLVASSTRSIRATLEKRLEVLQIPGEQMTLFPMWDEDELAELDDQDLADNLLKMRLAALKNEREEVKLLLEAAKECEQAEVDAKAEALVDWIYQLQQEENDPDVKILIFTAFVPTQNMLRELLESRGFSVVCLNGTMSFGERQKVQQEFADKARFMVSTEAGGEGLNLQFCHIVINYDLPWNPMKLEQRIGRVDRIGQEHDVRAINFVFEDTVEYRVREVLEDKLAIIYEELGIDKAGDVLDSAQAGAVFDDLYMQAIIEPSQIENTVEDVVNTIRQQALEENNTMSILGLSVQLDPEIASKLMEHPLPHWVQQMTVSYLHYSGGRAELTGKTWEIEWPDGTQINKAVFSIKDFLKDSSRQHLTLENPRIRGLVSQLPGFVNGQPIPSVNLAGMPGNVAGTWSLWEISIESASNSQRRIMPFFMHDDGRILTPTANRIWDELLNDKTHIIGCDDCFIASQSNTLLEQAQAHGKVLYEGLMNGHLQRLDAERKKVEYAYSARKRLIDKVGLPEVRNYRFAQLSKEKDALLKVISQRKDVIPKMKPLVILRVNRS